MSLPIVRPQPSRAADAKPRGAIISALPLRTRLSRRRGCRSKTLAVLSIIATVVMLVAGSTGTAHAASPPAFEETAEVPASGYALSEARPGTAAMADEATGGENDTTRLPDPTTDGDAPAPDSGGDKKREPNASADNSGQAEVAAEEGEEESNGKKLPKDATYFRGKGFDTCAAPSTDAMNAWRDSPYGAVGIYIGGTNRGCRQDNLTADWVKAQYENDWRFFPIYVGPQVSADSGSCTENCEVITEPESQGVEAAEDAMKEAVSLGFGKGSVLYYNLESYAPSPETSARATSFLEAWTRTLHDSAYFAGVYGSRDSTIRDLVQAAKGDDYVLPDVVYFANWDNKDTTDDPEIPANLWNSHQRIKQYKGDHKETHGGVTINIDSDQLDVGPESAEEPPELSGRSFGLSADAPLPAVPLSIEPTPDTGKVKKTKAPMCAQDVNALLVKAETLCAGVKAETDSSRVTATSTVAKAAIGLPGLPVLGLSGLEAISTSTCKDQAGSVDMTLTVAGAPVEIGDNPNHKVDLSVAGAELVVNEQIKDDDGGLTVNALHLTAPGGIEVVVASSTTTADNCT